ncbi:hypothetical protein [Streptomyces sp. NPDC002054]|uniref:hypothetical protein n=1 Tax=Streptomyces sp. NPDC002054 TaxID=3154663 RepID=UPI00331774BF
MRSQRFGRLAACTALAVAAGTLLSAAPAQAAGAEPVKPQPSASASKQQRTAGDFAPAPAKGTFAARAAKPRLDLDGDGLSDFMFRNHSGYTGSLQSTTDNVDTYKISGEATETARDMIAVGNIRGGWGTELLLWHGDGRLAMHQAYSTGTQAATWTGHGWQVYNKLIAAGDLTKDGRGDLLARTPSGDLYLYRATGAATGEPFAGRVKVGSGWGRTTRSSAPTTSTPTASPTWSPRAPTATSTTTRAPALPLPRSRPAPGSAAAGTPTTRSSVWTTGAATARPTCTRSSPTVTCTATLPWATASSPPGRRSAAAGRSTRPS